MIGAPVPILFASHAQCTEKHSWSQLFSMTASKGDRHNNIGCRINKKCHQERRPAYQPKDFPSEHRKKTLTRNRNGTKRPWFLRLDRTRLSVQLEMLFKKNGKTGRFSTIFRLIGGTLNWKKHFEKCGEKLQKLLVAETSKTWQFNIASWNSMHRPFFSKIPKNSWIFRAALYERGCGKKVSSFNQQLSRKGTSHKQSLIFTN